ncbi:uncharacterized protein C8Q71DRAFT_14238 [Rhodofomes roseus]|uniref:Uncharacterized protein n=1 Tax=Rhodofomes roseus TaxID=34475 RepID=A0ABQ8KWZ2_9APHY|nr:uncharacterized protein C8Q71DRAFT_14238 [Rhodofomes roseus]KAH9843809.1 hypothetical protein C8Q71DRAFT_14238 [Rhodofomes roseus]
MADTDKDELLRILGTHGQQFLGSFNSPVVMGKRKDTSGVDRKRTKKQRVREPDPEEEWSGISSSSASEEDEDVEESGQSGSEDESASPAHNGSAVQANVVVFSETQAIAGPSTSKPSKAQMKAFMSSKVAKLTQEVQEKSDDEPDDEGDELSNTQNDALLHRLVHTRILSGSLNPELNLTSAQRKKALAGRVLEAAGKAKLGKGERDVRLTERNKAAKRVREGMAAKQQERSEKQLEEAKHLGNYHPVLKKLYEASAQGPNRKREKGLRMGVGSFKGGVLKLSKDEINSVVGGGSRGGRGPGKRGGKR